MQSNEKKKDVKDPEDIPEDIPLMNEDEFSLVSLFSFLESDNKITMESLGQVWIHFYGHIGKNNNGNFGVISKDHS